MNDSIRVEDGECIDHLLNNIKYFFGGELFLVRESIVLKVPILAIIHHNGYCLIRLFIRPVMDFYKVGMMKLSHNLNLALHLILAKQVHPRNPLDRVANPIFFHPHHCAVAALAYLLFDNVLFHNIILDNYWMEDIILF